MVAARLSRWAFKDGKRNEVFHELDSTFGDVARKAPGYRGVLSLLSRDDPNAGLVITLWTDDASFKASESGVFRSAIEKVKENLKEPPMLERLTVFTIELKQLLPP